MVKVGVAIFFSILFFNFPLQAKKLSHIGKNSQSKSIKKQRAGQVVKKPRAQYHRQYLNDPQQRISGEFDIHRNLKPRVSFWFDVYTKYSSKQHIIHHTLHPWIVYDVIDTGHIHARYSDQKIANKKAEAYVRTQKARFRKILKKLSRLSNFKRLNKEEARVFRKVKYLGKNYKKILKVARKNIRSQTGQNNFFSHGVYKKHMYYSHIKPILEEHGVPTEIAALPLVESSFNVDARSKVGASGIWQIMPPTGKQYGIVNRHIDERNSPLKATLIAAKLLKFNHKILKNWPLAITAYNNGIGNIRKSMKRAGTKNPYVLINRFNQGAFGFASSNFYPSFLAALYASKYSKEIFNVNPAQPITFDKVVLKKKTKVREIISRTGLSLKDLKAKNLCLKKLVHVGTYLPKNFTLYLPKGYSQKLPLRPNKNLQARK